MILPLDIDGLTVRFAAGAPVLDNLTLRIAPGEVVGLAGESGSGKSVTALVALGLAPPGAQVSANRLGVDGVDMLGPEEIRRRVRGARAAMIFQEPMTALSPTRRVGDQLIDVLARHRKLRRGAARTEAIALLRSVKIEEPEEALRRFTFEMSGGMLQRVLIAMAFASSPALVIADEITTAIDASNRGAILELLTASARRSGSAVLMISHDLGVLRHTCDRILLLRRGVVVEEGPTAAMLGSPRSEYARMLLASLPERGEPGEPLLSPPTAKPLRPPGPVVLEARGVSVVFHRGRAEPLTAVDGIGLTLREGESLGVIGGSGSGKTTLVRALVGLQPLSRGEITLGEAALAGADRAAIARAVQFVFQDAASALDPRKPCWWLATEAAALSAGVRSTADRRSLAVDLFSRTGLPRDALDRGPHQLSGGQRQRLALARALAVRPKLLVLDEPTSALDVTVQARILDLLLEMNRDGIGLLLISHDISVVRHLCRRTVIMRQGRFVEEGATLEVLSNPQSDYGRSLVAAWRDLSLDRPTPSPRMPR